MFNKNNRAELRKKTNVEIGTRIYQASEKRGKSVRDIVEYLSAIDNELSSSSYYKYQSGEVTFPYYLLVPLADYLNVSLDYLLRGTTNNSVTDEVTISSPVDKADIDTLHTVLSNLTASLEKHM